MCNLMILTMCVIFFVWKTSIISVSGDNVKSYGNVDIFQCFFTKQLSGRSIPKTIQFYSTTQKTRMQNMNSKCHTFRPPHSSFLGYHFCVDFQCLKNLKDICLDFVEAFKSLQLFHKVCMYVCIYINSIV